MTTSLAHELAAAVEQDNSSSAPSGSATVNSATAHDWVVCDGCDEQVDRATLNPERPFCPNCGWSLWPMGDGR